MCCISKISMLFYKISINNSSIKSLLSKCYVKFFL